MLRHEVKKLKNSAYNTHCPKIISTDDGRFQFVCSNCRNNQDKDFTSKMRVFREESLRDMQNHIGKDFIYRRT